MRVETVELNKTFGKLGENDRNPTLTMYIPDDMRSQYQDRRSPAVIVCPGGAYVDLSERESEPVALFFVSMGFSAFVLNYSTAPNRFPTQLTEALGAVAYVRRNAGKMRIDSERIFVCGFSAGGHLAGSAGILGVRQDILDSLGVTRKESRPNGMILCYPVTDDDIFFEKINCFDFLFGKESGNNERRQGALSKNIADDTPPAFIWHTLRDETVPVRSSIVLADALERNGIPMELHIFAGGPHGLSLCNHQSSGENTPQYYNEEVGEWKRLFINWLKVEFDIKV